MATDHPNSSARQTQSTVDDARDPPLSRAALAQAARLDRTLQDLRTRVTEQSKALQELRASFNPINTEPAQENDIRFRQLRTYTDAYKQSTPREPYLPATDSPLPALLALRTTHETIEDAETCATTIHADLAKTQKRLEKERIDLQHARLIQTALEERIEKLGSDIDKRSQKSSSQIAKEMVRELQQNKVRYDKETSRLVKAFNHFVETHLAVMLAAEELGGPVVGEVLDIDQYMLADGFGSQPKRKKKNEALEDRRQRRIDDIWGPRPNGAAESLQDGWDEKRSAAAEMKDLTEQLLNNLAEAEGGSSGAYVVLERESAAARFLVRSRVAQFHPKDARRLRLIDFGRDLID